MKPSRLVLLALALALSVALTLTSAATTQYVAYSSHTDSACASVPRQAAYVAQSATTSDCASTTCVADAATGLYLLQSCVSDPSVRSTALFGAKPWVQFEIYQPSTACATLASVVAYVADGSCISVDDARSSLRAVVYANKSAAVATYDGAACAGAATKVNDIPATKLARASCLEGLLLASTGNATTEQTATKNHANTPIKTTTMALLGVATAVVALW